MAMRSESNVTLAVTASMIVPTLRAARRHERAKPEIGNRLNRFGQHGMQPNPEVRNHLDGSGNLQASLGPTIYSENKPVQP
jgi:ribose 1,5-bisphosphokinase PhnN